MASRYLKKRMISVFTEPVKITSIQRRILNVQTQITKAFHVSKTITINFLVANAKTAVKNANKPLQPAHVKSVKMASGLSSVQIIIHAKALQIITRTVVNVQTAIPTTTTKREQLVTTKNVQMAHGAQSKNVITITHAPVLPENTTIAANA